MSMNGFSLGVGTSLFCLRKFLLILSIRSISKCSSVKLFLHGVRICPPTLNSLFMGAWWEADWTWSLPEWPITTWYQQSPASLVHCCQESVCEEEYKPPIKHSTGETVHYGRADPHTMKKWTLKNLPEQTGGQTDRQMDDILWHNCSP